MAREVAGLGSTLPLNRSSSALVRIDEEKAVLWSIMLTGPEDTPYDGGCFIFDAFFPSGYPTTAPQLKFRTTGGGRVRFNPNLYKDGKVCLSLLGTWSGAKGEMWDPAVSTMLQVIVSVQSLILVNEPYFNEPGTSVASHRGRRQTERAIQRRDQRTRFATQSSRRYASPPPRSRRLFARTSRCAVDISWVP